MKILINSFLKANLLSTQKQINNSQALINIQITSYKNGDQ